jgi:hypothetical protein
VVAKWLIAVPAFASALLWNYCGLICSKPELGEPSTWAHAAGILAFFAVLLSGFVGVWIASRKEPPWSIAFAAAATIAFVVGPVLTFVHAPAVIVSFENGVVEGATVSLVGSALMVRALLRVSLRGARVEASSNAAGALSSDGHDDEG